MSAAILDLATSDHAGERQGWFEALAPGSHPRIASFTSSAVVARPQLSGELPSSWPAQRAIVYCELFTAYRIPLPRILSPLSGKPHFGFSPDH